MDFIRKRKLQNAVKSASDRRSEMFEQPSVGDYVKGSPWIDCLDHKWQKGEMLGILSGPGVGKTTLSLHILKDIIRNNRNVNNGVTAFVSLEMSEDEILDKWFKTTENEPELSDYLYVISNYNDDGSCRSMNVHDIKLELKLLKETLNVELNAYVLDHLHEINNNGGSDYNKVCEELRNMTKELNTFGIIQSQTTKEKGIGDVPVPRNGCYGTSRFENLMTYIITIFQPLRRVQNECDLPVLGWSYCKIRFKSKNDKVREEVNYVKLYDYDTENLADLSPNQITMFSMYYERVLELRESEEKKKAYAFDLSTTIKGKDGKEVKLTKIIGGREEA